MRVLVKSLFEFLKRLTNEQVASYKWGLDDPQDIKQLEPKLELVREISMHELVGFSRFPLWVRALYRVQDLNPTLRRMERMLVYRY